MMKITAAMSKPTAGCVHEIFNRVRLNCIRLNCIRRRHRLDQKEMYYMNTELVARILFNYMVLLTVYSKY